MPDHVILLIFLPQGNIGEIVEFCRTRAVGLFLLGAVSLAGFISRGVTLSVQSLLKFQGVYFSVLAAFQPWQFSQTS